MEYYCIGKVYKISKKKKKEKKKDTASNDSSGRVARTLVHRMGVVGLDLGPHVDFSFLSQIKILVIWCASGTVCDGTLKTKYPILVLIL